VRKRGFAPVGTAAARVLILGSLPGAESLRRREYYAQPRNAFWPILGALVGAGPALPYAARLGRLGDAGIALWDVCAAARREGSLDAAIEPGSVLANDFAAFYAAHPAIGRVCFNGRTAAALYRRHVLGGLPADAQALALVELPSTSPAHAAMSLAEKTRRWRGALAAAISVDPA
jgi:TDG/mug DNA glycosylase family protein